VGFSERGVERADSGLGSAADLPRRASRSQPVVSAEAQRRADLAIAATRGTLSGDLVLESDAESLALLGVYDEGPLLADVLRWQGTVLRERGQTADAEGLYTRSLKLAQKLDYLAGQSHAVNMLGAIAQRRGELHRSAQLFLAAQRMAEGCGDVQLAAMIQQNRGVVADMSGDFDAALEHYTASLSAFEAGDDTRSMTLVLNNLGLLQFKTGRYAEARKSYDRALALARIRGDLVSEGVIEENVAELEMLRGEMGAACESIARVIEIAALREDPLRRAAGLKLLAVSLRLDGRPAEALGPLQGALALSEECEDALLRGEVLFETGLAHSAVGNRQAARAVWSDALEIVESIGATALANRVRDALSG
jgi:tetratricopeptide (TPR) repeat protein